MENKKFTEEEKRILMNGANWCNFFVACGWIAIAYYLIKMCIELDKIKF